MKQRGWETTRWGKQLKRDGTKGTHRTLPSHPLRTRGGKQQPKGPPGILAEMNEASYAAAYVLQGIGIGVAMGANGFSFFLPT